MINQHFTALFPEEGIEKYLSSGDAIDPDNCHYQPVAIKNLAESGASGGYLIYSFLSQVFLKDKQLTADLKNIDFANWFSNVDSELDEIKMLLEDIPGVRVVEVNGQMRVEKRGSFHLNTPERSSSSENLTPPINLEGLKPFLEK